MNLIEDDQKEGGHMNDDSVPNIEQKSISLADQNEEDKDNSWLKNEQIAVPNQYVRIYFLILLKLIYFLEIK